MTSGKFQEEGESRANKKDEERRKKSAFIFKQVKTNTCTLSHLTHLHEHFRERLTLTRTL